MKSTKTLLPVLLIALCFSAVAQDAKAPLLPPPGTMLLVERESVCRHYSLESAKPEYPEQAQKAGIQGTVLALVWFDKDGKLVEAKVLTSPDESLADAVLSALRKWRISPHAPLYRDANYMSELRFVFTLKDGNAEVSEAAQAEQEKVSSEFQKEIDRRKKSSQ